MQLAQSDAAPLLAAEPFHPGQQHVATQSWSSVVIELACWSRT